ncbi:ribonuclease z [Lapidilactobacillus concavus DSM 17758]|jgi:ribonuclease Z|uniref:Ribonuclease Z n=1 Tax=Lapidilactobacillus concavus DSM 17758 TaxID=1423735 RepID=A0A0R1W7R9_9LACO|nr:ribonuclease Z [Lapidilactobacillus concavus]KRM13934.1 ribonuclease z [Lapidilactobacillus concavus DSM 17758]GEL13081.1 ribonuclease Z [Lapidilactobacillus concavus]
MEIEFLGTGAGVPARSRNVTSIALKLLDERNEVWLFDCGEGTQQQILKTTIKPRKVNKIFITHLHGDHIFGLPGFLTSRSNQGGETRLDLYGPTGIKRYVQTSLAVTGTRLSYPIAYHEITEPGIVFEDDQFQVSQLKLDHRIDSYGYRIQEAAFTGELLVDKLKAEQVPSGPIYGKLKAGETVSLPDGRVLNGHDYIGESRPGRIVAIMGDTRKTDHTITLAQDADVLVHESTFSQHESKLARQYFHSTSTQAAQIAVAAHCRRLLLTHISARYLGRAARQLQEEAREVFPNTRVVNDFDIIKIPLPVAVKE